MVRLLSEKRITRDFHFRDVGSLYKNGYYYILFLSLLFIYFFIFIYLFIFEGKYLPNAR